MQFEDACHMERGSLREIQATYIPISNIIGLRDYTNYNEVRISVEYVGPATCVCVAQMFSSYGIFTNP